MRPSSQQQRETLFSYQLNLSSASANARYPARARKPVSVQSAQTLLAACAACNMAPDTMRYFRHMLQITVREWLRRDDG